MATSYPSSVDTTNLTNPATTDKRNSPSHAGLHANANDAIKAAETKLGTGSSTPVASTLLFGTGTGTSAWQGLTSAQLAAVLSDETGTGSAVFATTPTLVTPKIDTINESTPGNGTTVGGVNIKSGVIQAPGTAIGQGNVSAAMLATSAIKLGSAKLTSNFTNANTAVTAVTGLSIATTVPAGGRDVEVSFSGICSTSSGAGQNWTLEIYDSTTSTIVGGTGIITVPTASYSVNCTFFALISAPSAGSHTYQLRFSQSAAGTFTVNASATYPAIILAKVI